VSTLQVLYEERAAARGPAAEIGAGRTLDQIARRIGTRRDQMGLLRNALNSEVRAGHVLRDRHGLYSLADDGLDPDVRLALRDMYLPQ
jgi:hypothetical protein